jgi:pimeloyl-ACP methyl ester carboxylesterase
MCFKKSVFYESSIGIREAKIHDHRLIINLKTKLTEVPFIESDNYKLFYEKNGTAPSALLLFHGFGQDHRAFDVLKEAFSDRFTLYSFDLFFHGQSEWLAEEEPLEKDFWKVIITQFLNENKIEKFSVLGFSMGGKFALATLELFPQQVSEIILLAPDGIKTNFWYSLATYPLAFRKIFKSLISHHERFLTIATLALQLKLIDRGVLRFVESQMNTTEKRKRVYYSWVVLRHFQFNLTSMADLINTNQINVQLLIGRYDKIITATNMMPFARKIPHLQFEIIEAGHNDLIQKSISYLRKK